MNTIVIKKILSIASVCILASCAGTGEYAIQRAKAEKELPAFEQAFKDANCFDLRFKFANGMLFVKDDALNSLKCLEIERTRNRLREEAYGIIRLDELAATNAYDSYKAIFSHIARGEITQPRALEIYNYVTRKSRMDASAEMDRSNRLLAQGIENRRREFEQENRNREIYLQSIQRNAPIITKCDSNGLGSITCRTN
jgi:hypothetical protein